MLTHTTKMASNESRKRKRVTFEEDLEATAVLDRVEGRENVENHGLSPGRTNARPGKRVHEDDVSTRHVGGVAVDASEAHPRENSIPMRQNNGRTTDSQQGEHRRPQALAIRAVNDGSMVRVTEAEILSRIRRLAGATTDTNLDQDEGDAPWADEVGPYRRWPIGTLAARAILGLVTGNAPRGDLDGLICNIMCHEMAMTHSPKAEVWTVSTPIMNPPPLSCDICHQDGTHSTGRCAMVTSEKHGDTNTDPFCDFSSSRAHDRHGNPTHGLQRSRDVGAPGVHIACARLAAKWEQGSLSVFFQMFVIERRRMAPLLVYTKDLCFIRFAILYSDAFCQGEMPQALEGMWPYTKADAIKYKDQLRRFYEIGMESMPAGELEGLTMAEIRARYDRRGGIPPQHRYQTEW